jgi:hypothetical protein
MRSSPAFGSFATYGGASAAIPLAAGLSRSKFRPNKILSVYIFFVFQAR